MLGNMLGNIANQRKNDTLCFLPEKGYFQLIN